MGWILKLYSSGSYSRMRFNVVTLAMMAAMERELFSFEYIGHFIHGQQDTKSVPSVKIDFCISSVLSPMVYQQDVPR